MGAMDDLEWIRKGLGKAGKTQTGLARVLKRAPSAVTNLLKGTRDLKQREVRLIADYLEVEPPAVPDVPEVNYRPPPTILGERDLKVFSAVEGGPGEMVVDTQPIDLVPRPWYMKEVRDGFAVLVVGESMVPSFRPGDMAIVNPRLPPQRNTDVILVSGEDEGEFRASIKFLIGWDAKQWHLEQHNPARKFAWLRKDWPKALRVVGNYKGG